MSVLDPGARRGGAWLMVFACLVAVLGCGGKEEESSEQGEAAGPTSVETLLEERDRLDATVFMDETEAQRYEQVFVKLWDDLRGGDPFEVLKGFPFEQLVLGSPAPAAGTADWGVEGIRPAVLKDPAKTFSHGEYVDLLGRFRTTGWKIAQTEWHHSYFTPPKDGGAPSSIVSFEIHAQFRDKTQPIIIKGRLKVTWKKDGSAVPDRIEGQEVELIARKGTPMFTEWMSIDPKQEVPDRYPRVSPILVHDLDGDGLPEIVLAGCNLVYRNRGGLKFEREDFLSHPIQRPAESGILADFTGNGLLDYVGGSLDDGSLLLFAGGPGGTFPNPPVKVFSEQLAYLHALTAGDIDGDGDLDLFLGQWKAPYAGGSMPTPYYDANDGHPDYLLRNEGGGKFTDVTESAGLAGLRNRRTFSASFVNLDGDSHLDLVVVADFSGMDLYRNKGDGTFENGTSEMVDQRHGFGMSHTFGDWNNDGNLDLYMVGMSSTTARRLDDLGLGRPGFEKYSEMRAPMTFGNRLLLGDGKGRFTQSPHAASAARTGWAWGCSSADFDLDGDEDLYIANGHLSGNSAKDYCTRFWCHDLYTGGSKANPIIDDFFTKELGMKLGVEYSWNGFEHNTLYLNQPGTGFLNAAFLLGVAFEYDSRAVVSDDLDADGRPDLLVVEYRTDTRSQRLWVYRNQYESSNHWVGVRIPRPPSGESVHGAVVTAKAGGRSWSKPVVSGDSFTAQHALVVHFGLGAVDQLDSLTVRWPSGKETLVGTPSVDRYHTLPAAE